MTYISVARIENQDSGVPMGFLLGALAGALAAAIGALSKLESTLDEHGGA
ncbi:MAG: hypothetical protein MUF51_00650 [Vicinamibacteria bacterium]|nr:hypothetical protein [Vicinamibacteria bacterium]